MDPLSSAHTDGPQQLDHNTRDSRIMDWEKWKNNERRIKKKVFWSPREASVIMTLLDYLKKKKNTTSTFGGPFFCVRGKEKKKICFLHTGADNIIVQGEVHKKYLNNKSFSHFPEQ